MPTKQETFDIVARHLLTQNEASMGDLGCSYRGENDTKCAAGCLIPDSDYKVAWEGKTVFAEDLEEYFTGRGFDIGLLEMLQDVHDMSDPPFWKSKLAGVAKHHGLSTAVLEEFDGSQQT